jgi:hypothetical protein
VKRAVKKVAKEVREEARETVKEEAQGAACESAAGAANSFVPGTKVLMADGSTKPIEKVRPGDKVVATDPKTGRTSVQTAAATIIGKGSKNLVRITLKIHDGSTAKTRTTTVTATAGHPFWVPSLREWIGAGELEPGQWVQTSSGTWIQIGAVKAWTAKKATVHNLTVTDAHTYYVLAGDAPVLVHNCGVSIKQVKMALGRAGMSVSKYDIVHVPQIVTSEGIPAYGNSPHDGSGKPNKGPRGRPVIQISDMGLADMDTAVATVFHEIYHHRMYRIWPRSMGGKEGAAEAYGQAMLRVFKRRTRS